MTAVIPAADSRLCYSGMVTPPRRFRPANLLLLLTVLVGAVPARAAYHPLEEFPVESPLYALVDAVVTQYGAPAGFTLTRPWTRRDLGRFLDVVRAATPAAANDPAVVRLVRELDTGDHLGGWEPAVVVVGEERSFELSPYLRADHREDRARREVTRDFRAGVQASAALGENVLLWSDVYAGTTSPGPHGNPADSRRFGLIEDVQLNSYYDRATATIDGRLGRLTLGHTWLRWGPGAWGTMALSDGAPALDVAEARTALGSRAQLTWFVAALETRDESFLAGHRLELRASPALQFTFSELARFDGVSNVALYALPVVPFSLLEKRIQKASVLPSDSLERLAKNNVMWAADFSWRPRPGARLYGEIAIDDLSFSSEDRPKLVAWQLGAHARRVRGPAAIEARAEYARVYAFTYSVYHRHDFAHAGLPTGFPLGPDVDRLTGRLGFSPEPDWTWALEGAFTRKGEGRLGEAYTPGTPVPDNLVLQGVLDRDLRAALAVDYSPSPALSLGLSAGYARVDGLGHAAARAASGPYGATRVLLRW